ncbi:histidine kinase [Paenibacillus sp. VCA1]|uniref:cache domain-containing sensor histidine kinase n=1 Tax=Paenibacillus sp. VCA1 TaxID=3039148 RepID=UPI002871D60E|nr:histidine kinase [Paenibacillus sp. VCA1]MDR9856930.1 histidine kinase [Paenibacillus sp. VCA1]
MKIKRNRPIFRLFKPPYSLKNRLLIILSLTALLPLAILGGITYYSMLSLLENKTEASVISHLHEVRMSLDNTFSQMNHVSQQLAFDGKVGQDVERYLQANAYGKKALQDEIKRELGVISFTNPNLGMIFYFSNETNERFFENYMADPSFSLTKLPLLLQANRIAYYGPHKSFNPLDGHLVFSAVRKVDLKERDDIYVYIETNYKWVEALIRNREGAEGYEHLIVDGGGRIAFTEAEGAFPKGGHFPDIQEEKKRIKGYYAFSEPSNQGWRVVTVISKSSYEHEVNKWIGKFTGTVVAALVISFLFALLTWRMFYDPLRGLIREIRDVKHRKLTNAPRRPGNLEFDLIHEQLDHMRARIAGLIEDIERSEREKSALELEKLMNRINPHFIHNTLDTIRWIARGEGHAEIDRLVSTLNKLLYYNLGKNGEPTVRAELEAIRSYISLQEVRYNVRIDVHIDVEAEALDLLIPRFILQPLVENALYHGLEGDGMIEVEIREAKGRRLLEIAVKDNGRGMDEETIRRLIEGREKEGNVGMGIGLQYVVRMLKSHYGGRAAFTIESIPGVSTTVMLTIPIEDKGDAADDKRAGCG